jgi:hypothetical protein
MRPFQTIIPFILYFATTAFGTAFALDQRDTNQQDLQGLPKSSVQFSRQASVRPWTTPGDDLDNDAPNLEIATSADTAPAACPGDVDLNGTVTTLDMIAIVAAWGECDGCPEDLDDDGFVDINDLLVFISGWGSPCP